MNMLAVTVLAAVVAMIAYGGFDLGGSVTAVIFLGILAWGACLAALKGYMLRGE